MNDHPNVVQTPFPLEMVAVADLHPHPRNYRVHPDDQIEHIIESIRANGVYRNIIVSRDNTILAGHGVVRALRKMGTDVVPVIRLDIARDNPRALKVMTGDNEIGRLAEIDDRALSEILKEISDFEGSDLLGTGYDERMLAALVFVTRPQSEIADFDAAAEWMGMPEFGDTTPALKVIVHFRNEADMTAFARVVGQEVAAKTKVMWWPPKENDDVKSIRFEG